MKQYDLSKDVPFDMDKKHFGGLTGEYCDYEKSKIIILPVPFDKTSTWQKGADKGPQAIIDASHHLEVYDIETDSEIYTLGMHTDDPLVYETSEEMVNLVKDTITKHRNDNKFVVMIGGEHSTSIGAFQTLDKDTTIIQLDAHSDMRDEYEDSKLNHACVMARAKEVTDIIQIGIRSMDISEPMDKDRVFFAKDIHDTDDWMEKAISRAKEKVYVTIDLDVFDPSIMPSTGTPEPGGLGWYQIMKFLKKISERKNIVGFDIVELCPNENNKAPDFLAAKLIYTFLSYIFAEESKKKN